MSLNYLIYFFVTLIGTSNGLTIDCSDIDNNSTYNCLSDIPAIPKEFLDTMNTAVLDIAIFQSIGGVINNNCGEVIITAQDSLLTIISDCDTTQTIQRKYTISDSLSSSQCVTTYYIEYETLTIVNHPRPFVIDCNDNIDSIFNDWLQNIGYADIKGCYNTVRTLPEEPSLEISDVCILGQEIANYRVQWFLEDTCSNTLVATIGGVVVLDNNPPVLTCPEDITIDISEPYPIEIILEQIEQYQLSGECGMVTTTNNLDATIVDSFSVQSIPITVRAIDLCLNESECTFKVDIVNSTSIKDSKSKINLPLIFPNPTFSSISIHNLQDENDIHLMDINAKVIKVTPLSGNKTTQVDMQDLPQGVYFIPVRINDKLHMLKVLKY